VEEVAGERENVVEETEEEREWEREVVEVVGWRKREEEGIRVSVTWHLRREWWWRDLREMVAICCFRERERERERDREKEYDD
jgi:hypothetical protein